MATDKQKAASRANGARSRGPKTPEGKARSARNSTSHGLLARAILLEGESRERFDDVVNSLKNTLKPVSPLDELLIGKMAVAHWRQIRLWQLEKKPENPSETTKCASTGSFSAPSATTCACALFWRKRTRRLPRPLHPRRPQTARLNLPNRRLNRGIRSLNRPSATTNPPKGQGTKSDSGVTGSTCGRAWPRRRALRSPACTH